MFFRLAIAVFAALTIAVSSAAQSPSEAQPPSLVLITIDTLRADYLSSYRSGRAKTPTMDALADDGVLFENAYCQVPLTPPSHASILTGTYPATHGVRDFTSGPLRPDLPTLATILKANRYQTAAFVSAFVLDRSWGLGRGFDLYYDKFQDEDFQGVNPGNVQRPADQTLDQVLPWLEKTNGPFFLWLHLFDPHHDYRPPEPFRSLYASDPYAGEVAWVDSQLARLVGMLKRQGIYDQTLVVLTSDHGEGLGDHGEQEHGFFLYEEAIRIPLIFKLPAGYELGQKRIPEVVQSIDILPSVLQILRIAPPPDSPIEGRGLLASMLGKRSSRSFAYSETLYPLTTFGWSPLATFREGDFKLVEAPRPELYDLSSDPGERSNLFAARSSLGKQLQQNLKRLESSFSLPSVPSEGAIDFDTLEKLGALGYLAVGAPLAGSGSLDDPKDRIGVYQQVLQGLQAAEANQLDQSNSILQAVARDNPELFIVFYQLGNNYLKLEQADRALENFAQARRLNPAFKPIDLNTAQALRLKGDLTGAITLIEPLAKQASALPRALQQLASLYQQTNRHEEAEPLLRRLLQQRPDDSQASISLGVSLVMNRKYQEGLEVLDAALKTGTRQAQVENFRGIALANLGKTPEALQAYRSAIELNPRYPQPRLNLSLTLLQMGSRQEAREEFERLCQLDPTLCGRYKDRFGQ